MNALSIEPVKVNKPVALMRAREKLREQGDKINWNEIARTADVAIQTITAWRRKGWMDLDNDEIQLQLEVEIGPATMKKIAQQAYGLTLEAQRQTAMMLSAASAKEASRIAYEQEQIGNLASGQATAHVKIMGRIELIDELKKAGLT